MVYRKNREADNARYGDIPMDSGKMLADMGYMVDEEGRIGVNSEVVAKNNARREAEREAEQAEQQRRIDRDNDYMRWKTKWQQGGLG